MAFDVSVYRARLDRLRTLLAQEGISAFLASSGVDLQYLIGTPLQSHERLSALIITQDTCELIVPTVERGEVIRARLSDLGMSVHYWVDGDRPREMVADRLMRQDAASAPSVTVAVGAEFTAGHLLPIMQEVKESQGADAVRFVSGASLMADLIALKDAAEQEELSAAAAAIDRVHAQVPSLLRVGRTEREVAADLERLILAEHSAVDFIIVGSGPHGANAHHDFSDRVLAEGDIVVVDIGGTYGAGYHSDCTRTYVIGEPTAEQQRAYDVLYAAQEAACRAIRPGATAAEIDRIARNTLADAGLAEFFIHRTGHGIGLSTHEEPFIMEGNDRVLEPGMAFSVEPGIYFEDQWGARIEDIVIVTDDGYRSVNQQPRTLVQAEQNPTEASS